MTREFTPQEFNEALLIVIGAYLQAADEFPHWPVSAALDGIFKGHPLERLLTEHAKAAAMHLQGVQHLLNVGELQR
jgi:hypothetical protein